MKVSFQRWIAALATATLSVFNPLNPVTATPFGHTEVAQENFIAIAAPVGQTANFQLLIVEQVADSRLCWSESGFNPVQVQPLLLNFDFTGICGRSTDSNGYSIRVDGQDLGLYYSLRVARKNNDLVLKGVPLEDSGVEFEIGRANGIASGFIKIELHPGWRFTKRSYQGRTLGHVYLTYDRS